MPGFSNYMRWKNYWKMYMPTSGDFAEAEQIFIMNDQYKTEIQMENASNTINNINSITPQQWNELGPKNLSNIKSKTGQNWLSAHEGNQDNYSGNHVAKVRKIYQHPIDKNKIYALGGDIVDCGGGVFYSEDYGHTWEVMNTDLIHLPKFTSLAIKPEGVHPDPGEEYIFITHLNGAVYRMKKSEGVWIQCTYNTFDENNNQYKTYCFPIKACGNSGDIAEINADPKSLPFANVFYNVNDGIDKAINNELDFAKKDINSSRYSRMFVCRDNGLYYTDNPDASLYIATQIGETHIESHVEWTNLCESSNLGSLIDNITTNNFPNLSSKDYQFMDFESYEKNGEVVYLAAIQTIEKDANGDYIDQSFFYEYLFKSTDFGNTWQRVGENITNSPDNRAGFKYTVGMSTLYRPINIEVKYNNPDCYYVVGSHNVDEYNVNKYNTNLDTWELSETNNLVIGGVGSVDANTFVMDPDNNNIWWIMSNEVAKYENGSTVKEGDGWYDFHSDIRDVLIIEDTFIVATDGGIYRSLIGNNEETMDISSEGMNMSQSRSLAIAQDPPFYVGSGFWHCGIQVYNPETQEWHWGRTVGDGSFGYVSFLDNEVFVAGNQHSVQRPILNYNSLTHNSQFVVNYMRASENIYDLYFVIDNNNSNYELMYATDPSDETTIQGFAGNGSSLHYAKGTSIIREIPNMPNRVSTLNRANGPILRIFEGVNESTPTLNIVKEFDLEDVYKNLIGTSDNPGANSLDYVFDPRGNGDFYLILNGSPDFDYLGQARIVKYDASMDEFEDISFPADDNYEPNHSFFSYWMSITDIEMDRQTGVLYLGTAHGVYYLDESDPNNKMWRKYSVNVPMFGTQLGIRHCTGEIFASTGFRGIWNTDLKRNENTPTMDWKITSNETWEDRMNLFCTLVIEPGATLTVKDELIVYGMQKIVVKPGGRLIVDGGHITSNCGDFWKGIEVEGNHNLSQTMANQGYLLTMNGAVIENAKIAVNLWGHGSWSTTGGMVNAYNTTFRNNWKSFEFMPYHDFYSGSLEHPYRARIWDCDFEWTNDYETIGNLNINPAITLYDVNGVDIRGCNFHDQRDYVTKYQERATGILSLDATYKVLGKKVITSGPTPEEYDDDGSHYIPGVFTDMHKGVFAMNSNSQANVTVDQMKFVNSRIGIELSAVDNAMLTRNMFEFTTNHVAEIPKMNQIIMDKSSGFQVEGNVFKNSDNQATVDGVIVTNSGLQENEIFKNKYQGVYASNIAFGVNTNDESTDDDNPDGLQWKCNDYSSRRADQLFISASAVPGDQNGVRLIQGVEGLRPTGNKLTQGYNVSNGDAQFRSNDPDELTYHFYSGYPNEELTEYIGLLTPEPVTDENTCPSSFNEHIIGFDSKNILRDLTKNNLLSELESSKTEYKSKLKDLENHLKDNNPQSLYDQVSRLDTNTWEGLHNTLKANSPYLELDLIKTLGDQSNPHYPHEWFREILLLNPEILKSSGFMDYLDNKRVPMPDNIIQDLEERRFDNISARGELLNRMYILDEDIVEAENLLLKSTLSDTTSVDWTEAKERLKSRGDHLVLQQLVDQSFGVKELDSAQIYIQQLKNSSRDSEYSYISSSMMNLADFKYFVLNSLMDSDGIIDSLRDTQVSKLKYYRDKFANEKVSDQAGNLLCYFRGDCKSVPTIDYNAKSINYSNSSRNSHESLNESDLVKVIPNPNDGKFVIELLEGEIKSIKIHSIEGKEHNFDENRISDQQVSIELSNFDPGIFIVKVFMKDGIVKNKRIIIE